MGQNMPSAPRELDIRRALRQRLINTHSHDPGTLIINELGLCQGSARVDLAVVNGTLNGFEIKSERDTLERLPGQETVYSRTLDSVTIVSASTHVEEIQAVVPPWWTIWSVQGHASGVSFKTVRRGSQNPEVDPHAIVQLLWREEAIEILKEFGLEQGMLSKPRRAVWNRLTEHCTVRELRDIVRRCLKDRLNWRSAL